MGSAERNEPSVVAKMPRDHRFTLGDHYGSHLGKKEITGKSRIASI